MRFRLRTLCTMVALIALMITSATCMRVRLPGTPMPSQPADISLQRTGHDVRQPLGYMEVRSVLSFSPDGSRLASCDNDRIRVWDIASASLVLEVRGFCSQVKYSPSGKWLMITIGPSIRVINSESGAELRTLDCYRRVLSLAWSPDGRHFATCNADGVIDLWNADPFEHASTFATFYRERYIWPSIVHFVSNEQLIIVRDWSRIRLWDLSSGQQVRSFSFGGSGGLAGIGAFANGEKLVAVTRLVASFLPTVESYAFLLDLKTGRRQKLSVIAQELAPVSCSADGSLIAFAVGAGRREKDIGVYSVARKRFIRMLSADDVVQDLAFSPDGKYLAAAGKTVRIWRCDGF